MFQGTIDTQRPILLLKLTTAPKKRLWKMYKYIVFKARSNLYKLLCPPARSNDRGKHLSPIGALVYYFQQISSRVSSNNPNN